MNRNTRDEILEAAKLLFTKRGYNAVSVKDIADYVGISKGNLTYHFKKKEQIMEALLDKPVDEKYLTIPHNIEELDAFFRHQYQVIHEAAFYFLHHAQIGQISEEIGRKQKEANERIHRIYKGAIENLLVSGDLKETDASGRKLDTAMIDHIADVLNIGIIYWIPYHNMIRGENCEAVEDEILSFCWNQLYPWCK